MEVCIQGIRAIGLLGGDLDMDPISGDPGIDFFWWRLPCMILFLDPLEWLWAMPSKPYLVRSPSQVGRRSGSESIGRVSYYAGGHNMKDRHRVRYNPYVGSNPRPSTYP